MFLCSILLLLLLLLSSSSFFVRLLFLLSFFCCCSFVVDLFVCILVFLFLPSFVTVVGFFVLFFTTVPLRYCLCFQLDRDRHRLLTISVLDQHNLVALTRSSVCGY